MTDPKISELTVSQLRQLIKKTVQEAMVEVLIEINTIADAEDDLLVEAEMTQFMKQSMRGMAFMDYASSQHVDD